MLATIVLIAMISDIYGRRISNRLIVVAYIICIAKALGSRTFSAILQVVIDLSTPVIILYLLYLIGVIGAGDIKLLSVISGFTGMIFAGKVTLLAFLLGGVWSVARLLQEKSLMRNMYAGVGYIWNLMQGKMTDYQSFSPDRTDITIPFSVCIGIGTYMLMLIEMM